MAQKNTLFLACTRPALYAGIPIEACAFSLFFCVGTFTASGMFVGNGLFAGILRVVWLFVSGTLCYVTCRLLTARDHNIFRVLWIWVQTKGRTSRNAAFWGGSSTSPVPVKRSRKRQEIPHLV